MKQLTILILSFSFISTSLLASSDSNLSACERAEKTVRKVCTTNEISNQIAQLIRAIDLRNSTNTRGACAKAQQIAQSSLSGNLSYAVVCGHAAQKCNEICHNESSNCEFYEYKAKLAQIQVIANATQVSKSQKCVKVASENFVPTGGGIVAPGIESGIKPSTTPNPVPPSFQDLKLETDVSDLSEQKTYESTQAKINQHLQEGEGFSRGSSQSFTFGDEKSIPEGDKIQKEILLPSQQSVAALGTSQGGAGGAQTASPNGKDDGFKLDLKDFLPNGRKAPPRIPAGAFADHMITPANGLTNFQKVTRKMNEKRPELLP